MRAVVLLAILGLALKAEARSLDVEAIVRLAFPHRNAEAKQFGEFVLEYQREYASKEEVVERFLVFANNLEKIQRFNEEAAGQTEYGITRFADWSWEEFRSTLLLKEKPTFNTTKFALLDPNPENKALPDSWDWRKSNIVVGIKDQGQCGSCWSFATAAIVESMHAKAGKGLESLAEQQMVDCIEGACNGGNLEHSFGYAKDHGLPLEKDYPYHAVKGSCHDAKIAAKLNEMYILPHDEEKIAYSVHDGGPTAIGIEVGETFQHYKNGIISSTDCNGTNSWHAVAIIGFGVDNGKKFWIIKNSWGTSWGEKGFANVHRGSNWCHSAESAVAGGIW